MPSLAVSFGGKRAPYIFSARDRFEMHGIDAITIAAKMIDLQAFRDGSDKGLIHGAVSRRVVPASAIAVPVDAATPRPTRVLIGEND